MFWENPAMNKLKNLFWQALFTASRGMIIGAAWLHAGTPQYMLVFQGSHMRWKAINESKVIYRSTIHESVVDALENRLTKAGTMR